jgi:hypothetical protein
VIVAAIQLTLSPIAPLLLALALAMALALERELALAESGLQWHFKACRMAVCTSRRLTWHWWVFGGGNMRLFMGGAGGAAVAGGAGSGEGERLRQWWACRGTVGAAAEKCLHGSVVGARGRRRACCGVGEAVAEPQWRGGMMEAAGVTLHCWCIGGLLGHEGSGRWGLVGTAFPGQESSGARLRKGSDNRYVIGVGVWQDAGWGGARHLPQQPSEMTSLTLAEVPWWRSLHGWTLSCSSNKGNGDGNGGKGQQRG